MTTRAVIRLLALALVFLGLGGCSGVTTGPTKLTVELADSAGLFEGNDVGVLGVRVGKITDIKPKGDKVLVSIQVDPDVKIPSGAGAVVVSRSMATDRYVELTPAYSDGPTMKTGSVIPVDRTRTPVEWDQVLGAVNAISNGLNGKGKDAQPLRRMLDASAAALGGNGQTINQTVHDLVTGVDTISSHQGDLKSAIVNLGVLMRSIVRNKAVVAAFIKNIDASTAMVDQEKGNLQAALGSLDRTVALLATFVRNRKGDLSGTVGNLQDLARRMMKHQAALADGSQAAVPEPVARSGDRRCDLRRAPSRCL
jgi:phospholipid/cholesterol/gamma-HCH transport system substrate-binding protein